MFRSKRNAITVTVAQGVLESIFDECDKYDADETGGRLLGTYRRKGSGFEVNCHGVIGPGPGARRSSTSFFQDGDYQEQVFRSIEAANPEVEHLGNWHTHHVNGFPTLSGGDVSTYRNIVNHKNHNTDFFYALLVVRRNPHGNPRYEVRHYFLRRGDETIYEIPESEVRVVDSPLLTPASGAGDIVRASRPLPRETRTPDANPQRAKDQDFFAEFYPALKTLFNERLGAPYWKGPLTLLDGSHLNVVAVESQDGSSPEYSIVTSGDHPTCAQMLAAYRTRKFPSARHAIIQLERDLNREIYRARQ